MGNDNCEDQQHFYLLGAACIGFLAGAIFLLLILVIVAATLWKCGIRLEKRGKPPTPTVESPQSPGEPVQPETPPNEAGPQRVPDQNETAAETRHNASAAAAVCSRCSRSVTTSSGRQSFRMLASLRRRSRKANSDPLNYSKQLHRRARCVSLGTELQRKRKLSDTVDFMAPCFFRRPGSLWTRVSADESIVYENDHVIVISRERQKHVCQLCGHKRPGPPAPPPQPTRHSQQSVELRAASTAPHGTHGNAQRHSGRPACEGTSKVKQHPRGGRVVHPLRCVSGACDMHELFTMGHIDDPLSGNVAGSSHEETLDDGDGNVGHERCLDCSELWSVESQEDAGSDADCCTDKPPVSSTIDFIGHAVTSRGRALIFGRYPSAGKQD